MKSSSLSDREGSSFHPDPRWWPAVAASLSKPWPEAAACNDLCWWQYQVLVEGERTPSRRQLCERWGWPDGSRIRRVMRAVDLWVDPGRPIGIQSDARRPI